MNIIISRSRGLQRFQTTLKGSCTIPTLVVFQFPKIYPYFSKSVILARSLANHQRRKMKKHSTSCVKCKLTYSTCDCVSTILTALLLLVTAFLASVLAMFFQFFRNCKNVAVLYGSCHEPCRSRQLMHFWLLSRNFWLRCKSLCSIDIFLRPCRSKYFALLNFCLVRMKFNLDVLSYSGKTLLHRCYCRQSYTQQKISPTDSRAFL